MASEKMEKIVVVGFGWVGQANALALARMGYAVAFYDIAPPKFHYSENYFKVYEKLTNLQNALEWESPATWYIVCVGDRVSPEGHQDISLIERVLEQLKSVSGRVILRSTVLPAYLDALPFAIYLPEFLHEVRAVEECFTPFYCVVGQKSSSVVLPSFIKEWKKRAYRAFEGTPEEASHIKYLSNIWNAVRIAFVNEFGNSIAVPATESDRQRIERVIDFIFEQKSYVRYGRSFGGHCLPKDLRAYRALKTKTFSVPLLDGISAANDAQIQIEEKYNTLPQWFSTWDYTASRSDVRRLWDIINQSRPIRVVRKKLKPLLLLVEGSLPDQPLSKVKERWNSLAKENPYYYANPETISAKSVDEYEARSTGEQDYKNYVANDARIVQTEGGTKQKSVLEIGVGVGRMTEFFARDWHAVYGVDISPTMLEIAKKRLKQFTNVTLAETNGNSLPFASDSFDCVFSHKVFKYVASPVLLSDYFKEIYRVLKKGGVGKIQLRTGPAVHRWRWFYGYSIQPNEAKQLAALANLQVVDCVVEDPKNLWLIFKK